MPLNSSKWLILFIIFLAGCVPRFTLDELNSIKTVGVISVMGNTFYGLYQPTTIFQIVEHSANIEEWELNDYIRDVSHTYLKNCSRYTLVPIPHNSNELFKKYHKHRKDRKLFEPTYDLDRIKPALIQLAREHNVDLLLVIKENWFQDFGRGHIIKGYMLYRSSFLGMADAMDLFVMSEVGALDLKTNRFVHRFPYMEEYMEDFQGAFTLTYNPQEVVWKDSFDEYTIEEKQRFREIIQNKLAQQIFDSFLDMQIISGKIKDCQKSN